MPNTHELKHKWLSSGIVSSYFLVPDTVVDENKDAVECVEDTEGGGDGQGRAVEEE